MESAKQSQRNGSGVLQQSIPKPEPEGEGAE